MFFPSVVVCIGDSFAAIVGNTIGKLRIGKKSVEGLITGAVCAYLMMSQIQGLYQVSFDSYNYILKIGAVMAVEFYTCQTDNLMLGYISVLL